ncbi:hypothetical protein NUSPORA_02703 [Nucleospora cyclopteri]
MSPSFKIQRVHENAKIPDFTNNGYNIYAVEETEVKENTPIAIPTGLKMSFEKNYCAFISKYSLKTLGGLIDSDYRGEVKVIVISKTPRIVKKGEIIAKMHMLEIVCPEIEAQQGYPSDANIEVK